MSLTAGIWDLGRRPTPDIAADILPGESRDLRDEPRFRWGARSPATRVRRATARLAGTWESIPVAWRLTAVAVAGALAAAGVGYATAQNPDAAPRHFAVLARVAIILLLLGAGIFARTSRSQARMGALLVLVAFYAPLWLLNGSADPLLFSVAALLTALAPVLVSLLLLVHPTGQLHSRAERRFIVGAAVVIPAVWVLGLLLTRQPPIRGAFLRCTPHCPKNVFALGSLTSAAPVFRVVVGLGLIGLLVGTAIFITRRAVAAPRPLRRSIMPVWFLSLAIAMTGAIYFSSLAMGLGEAPKLAGPYVATSVMFPLVILIGLTAERLSLAQALADLMNRLAENPGADPELLMSQALDDPSLRIGYRRPGRDVYVDSAGEPMPDLADHRATTLVERDDRQIAAVSYNAELQEQEEYVRAAATAAIMRLEKSQLEAELKASTSELAASRTRLVELAHAERRRLERDLHDGLQQQLVGLRIKLDLATDMLKEDAAEGEHALEVIGEEMDAALQSVRALARGIYPSLLRDSGLREALKSAARSSPVPASVSAKPIGRYAEDVEVAVYFCCLEALQNVAKHAGRGAEATIALWHDAAQLHFSVRDDGHGFDPDEVPLSKGLTNMRDRVEAIGGTLAILTREGSGTTVIGAVPVEPLPA